MHVLTWLCTAALLGANLLALVAIGAVLIGRAETATQRRAWAARCAASALGLSALAAVMCGASIVRALPAAGVEPSARATRLAMGLSEAMNSIAFGVLGSAFPFIATGVLLLLARRAARRM